MQARQGKADGQPLTTAHIGGSVLVPQRVGMDNAGAFPFNGVRFALGALSPQ